MRSAPRSLLLATLPFVVTPVLAAGDDHRLRFPMRPAADDTRGVRLELDPVGLAALAERDRVRLDGTPLPDGTDVSLNLRRVRIVSGDDARYVVDGVESRLGDAAYDLSMWSGSVVGEPDSFAFVAFSPHGTRGLILRERGMVQLRPDGGAGAGDAMMVAVAPDGGEMLAHVCSASEIDQPDAPPPFVPPSSFSSAATGSLKEAQVAVETDYQFYDRFDYEDEARTYALTLLGAVSALYAAEVNVVITVPYLGIHTKSDDGWNAQDLGGGASSVLSEFKQAWSDGGAPVSAHLYHFLSGAKLGGGIAYLGVLCSQWSGFGVSGNINGGLTVPVTGTAPWDLVVTAHELGHNFGAYHTHELCPPVDECASSSNFGPCQTKRVCIPDGTIMSYCHTCSGGLANIDLEFHPDVKALMNAEIASSCIPDYVPSDALCLDQADVPLEIDPQVSSTAARSLLLANCADPAVDTDWSAALLEPAPWLQVSPMSGTIGDAVQQIDLDFDATGLDVGLHETTLRIQNLDNLNEVEDVPVSLLVLAPRFEPGDRLAGAVSSANDVDHGGFDGIKDLVVKLKVDHPSGSDPVRITLFDELDVPLGSWTAKSGKLLKKKVKLDRDGYHYLRVESSDGAVSASGDYDIKTARKLPDLAEDAVHKKVQPQGDADFADVKLRALAGASLDVKVKPNQHVVGPLTLTLIDPDDHSVDVAAQLGEDGLSFAGVLLANTGLYRLRISGFQGPKEKVKVVIHPTQPIGDQTVVID